MKDLNIEHVDIEYAQSCQTLHIGINDYDCGLLHKDGYVKDNFKKVTKSHIDVSEYSKLFKEL
jgi:hypothetical protein